MDVDELPDAVARTAHRIVQEALTNVHKHARGAATVVTIGGDERHGVTVEVVNRRPVGGAALLPGSGAGLLGLGERVALVGGTFGSGPTPEGGWCVDGLAAVGARRRADRRRPGASRDPRPRHRRRGARAGRPADDPRVGRRHHRRRRGRRRRRRRRGRPPLPARRGADGHPHAPARRAGGDDRHPRRRGRAAGRSSSPRSTSTTTCSGPSRPAPTASCSRTRRRWSWSRPCGSSPPATRCCRRRSPAG